MSIPYHPFDPDSLVTALDCFPARLPLKQPMKIGGGRIDGVDVLYVRVRTAGGACGWGEAIADPGNAGETVRGAMAMIDARLRQAVVGHSVFARAALVASLASGVFANGGAITAIDMALLDVAGKMRGVPAVELLGGSWRTAVPVLSIVGGVGTMADTLSSVEALRADGVAGFKLKVGLGDVRDDIETFTAIRAALGDDVFLAADANMAWSIPTALRFARAAAEAGIAYLEQPIGADNARMALLARRSPAPISADEAIHGLNDIAALTQLNAIAGLSLKAIKLGGLGAMLRAATIADGLGLSVGLAMMMESGLATRAMIHAACAVPQLDWKLNLGCDFLADSPVAGDGLRRGGVAPCPGGPGLGVDVDERRIASFVP